MEIENNLIMSSVLWEEDYEDEAEDEELEQESRAGYYNTAGFAFLKEQVFFLATSAKNQKKTRRRRPALLLIARLDRQLQDLVYKLVPHLEQNEKRQLHEFYKERGLEVPKPVAPQPAAAVKAIKQKKGLLAQSVFTIPPELDVSLVLEFVGAEEGIATYKPLETKYVRVSGEATIRHVEMFIRRKMELTPGCTSVATLWQVDLVCGDHLLERYQSLREVQSTIGESAIQVGIGCAYSFESNSQDQLGEIL
ncbi:Polycomb group RING finger protein 6 [Acipenser ruthenus]|uniref:Polycomb group RING finger protein 6 n=1 Tax=Acipenser ruthenus TaxID=7906 RepID=A0A444TWZ0_ACIRT|nr:Polycomb group RING finger protein 6 [Acipenser ruthenus]